MTYYFSHAMKFAHDASGLKGNLHYYLWEKIDGVFYPIIDSKSISNMLESENQNVKTPEKWHIG